MDRTNLAVWHPNWPPNKRHRERLLSLGNLHDDSWSLIGLLGGCLLNLDGGGFLRSHLCLLGRSANLGSLKAWDWLEHLVWNTMPLSAEALSL